MNIKTPQILKIILFEAAIIVINGATSKKSVKPFSQSNESALELFIFDI